MTIRHTPHQLRGAPPVERAAGVAAGGGPRFDPLPTLWRHLAERVPSPAAAGRRGGASGENTRLVPTLGMMVSNGTCR